MEITFTEPLYLLFLIIVPLLIFAHFYSLKYGKKQALKFANFEAIRRVTGEQIITKNVFLLFIRIIIVLLLVLTTAGTTLWYTSSSAKYDMVIALDASSSMLAKDYNPNRFEVTKAAMQLFLDTLPGKVKIGLVTFSGAAFIKTLPTDDKDVLKKAINNLEILELGGTDLGSAIITSANLMLSSENPKVIILITDGQSNIGVPYEDALDYIKEYHIVIHTIGIASREGGTISDIGAKLKLDEETLKDIAAKTGGYFFKPTDEISMRNMFEQISRFEEKPVSLNLSPYFLMIALILLLIEWILVGTKYKII